MFFVPFFIFGGNVLRLVIEDGVVGRKNQCVKPAVKTKDNRKHLQRVRWAFASNSKLTTQKWSLQQFVMATATTATADIQRSLRSFLFFSDLHLCSVVEVSTATASASNSIVDSSYNQTMHLLSIHYHSLVTISLLNSSSISYTWVSQFSRSVNRQIVGH